MLDGYDNDDSVSEVVVRSQYTGGTGCEFLNNRSLGDAGFSQ